MLHNDDPASGSLLSQGQQRATQRPPMMSCTTYTLAHQLRFGVADHVARRFCVHIVLYWDFLDDLLSEWLEILHEVTNDLKVPEEDDHVRQVASKYQRALKIQALLTLIVEYYIKN